MWELVAAVASLAAVAVAVAWTTYLLHVGLLDARDLSQKVGGRPPVSALEWPEMRIDALVASDDDGVVLMATDWPACPSSTSLLVLGITEPDALQRLASWEQARTSVFARRVGSRVELRRRRSTERVHVVVLDEDPT